MTHAASGGVTHFAVCPDDDDSVMTVAWYALVRFLSLGRRLTNGVRDLRGQNAANGACDSKHIALIA
jgi:hypothetical protein